MENIERSSVSFWPIGHRPSPAHSRTRAWWPFPACFFGSPRGDGSAELRTEQTLKGQGGDPESTRRVAQTEPLSSDYSWDKTKVGFISRAQPTLLWADHFCSRLMQLLDQVEGSSKVATVAGNTGTFWALGAACRPSGDVWTRNCQKRGPYGGGSQAGQVAFRQLKQS